MDTVIGEDGKPDFGAMFDAMATSLLDALTGYVDDRTSPLEEMLTQPRPDPQDPQDPPVEPVDPNDPLGARVQALEKLIQEQKDALEAKETEAAQAAFREELTKAIGTHGPRPEVAGATKDLLTARLQGFKQTDTGWLSPEGKTVGETVGAFFSSDEGKAFLPPKGAPGAPVDKGGTPTPGGSGDKVTLEQAIAAF